jgi:hypothetical protein
LDTIAIDAAKHNTDIAVFGVVADIAKKFNTKVKKSNPPQMKY